MIKFRFQKETIKAIPQGWGFRQKKTVLVNLKHCLISRELLSYNHFPLKCRSLSKTPTYKIQYSVICSQGGAKKTSKEKVRFLSVLIWNNIRVSSQPLTSGQNGLLGKMMTPQIKASRHIPPVRVSKKEEINTERKRYRHGRQRKKKRMCYLCLLLQKKTQ